jgi:hypothetical protein
VRASVCRAALTRPRCAGASTRRIDDRSRCLGAAVTYVSLPERQRAPIDSFSEEERFTI